MLCHGTTHVVSWKILLESLGDLGNQNMKEGNKENNDEHEKGGTKGNPCSMQNLVILKY